MSSEKAPYPSEHFPGNVGGTEQHQVPQAPPLYPQPPPAYYETEPHPPTSNAGIPMTSTAPPYAGGTTTTTTVFIASAPYAHLGTEPTGMTCPHCNAQIVTRIDYRNGLLSWLLVGGLFLFGCVFGCCLIPLCVNSCQDVEHYCPNCKAFLGVRKRL